MIRIELQPEPDEFDQLVRQKGIKFLTRKPMPKGKEWNNYSYWRDAIPLMRKSYREICAYSCHWIPSDTGSNTIEHYKPKDSYPNLAYEWTNYRLASGTLNGRKGTREDILDPCEIETGWFVINFPSLLVKPAPLLPVDVSQAVQLTIDVLGLNDEGTCLHNREGYIKEYCLGEIPFHHLEKKAPFVASELKRQNLIETVKHIMSYK